MDERAGGENARRGEAGRRAGLRGMFQRGGMEGAVAAATRQGVARGGRQAESGGGGGVVGGVGGAPGAQGGRRARRGTARPWLVRAGSVARRPPARQNGPAGGRPGRSAVPAFPSTSPWVRVSHSRREAGARAGRLPPACHPIPSTRTGPSPP